MSRVCLVGTGVPAYIPSRVHTGPGLRLEHFARSLAAAGHELMVCYVDGHGRPQLEPESVGLDGGLGADAQTRLTCVAAHEKHFENGGLDAALAEFRPAGLVGVGVQGAALAARLRTGLPLWADVFGDPMAEAQAKAVLDGDDGPLVRFWNMLGPVLAEADRFSAVSRRQADALLGQLGLAGRLSRHTSGEDMVTVIPCAAQPAADHDKASLRLQLRERLGIASDDFVVLWSGSFNTWCDTDTLFEGLELAMTAEPGLRFVATGGEVKGHDERSYDSFRRRVGSSRYRRRYHLAGWVDSQELPAFYAAADLGVVSEYELYERRFGSENRVAQWLAHGLAVATSAKSELGRCLAARELALVWTAGQADSLANCLVGAAGQPQRTAATGEAGRRWAGVHLGLLSTAAPLLEWCSAPRRSGDAAEEAALSLGLFSEPDSVVHLLENYLAGLGPGQLSWRSLRWLWRRLTGRRPDHRGSS